ncbi:winged helix-turn-helix domain-containing protein, partial [Streptomyces sp. T21Q-yed]
MRESQTNLAGDLLLHLGRPGDGPLHERVKRALRTAIRDGRIEVGTALPPSRQLATDLGCSRWAVTEAYSQLVAEGYLQAQTGSATRVRWTNDA